MSGPSAPRARASGSFPPRRVGCGPRVPGEGLGAPPISVSARDPAERGTSEPWASRCGQHRAQVLVLGGGEESRQVGVWLHCPAPTPSCSRYPTPAPERQLTAPPSPETTAMEVFVLVKRRHDAGHSCGALLALPPAVTWGDAPQEQPIEAHPFLQQGHSWKRLVCLIHCTA